MTDSTEETIIINHRLMCLVILQSKKLILYNYIVYKVTIYRRGPRNLLRGGGW